MEHAANMEAEPARLSTHSAEAADLARTNTFRNLRRAVQPRTCRQCLDER